MPKVILRGYIIVPEADLAAVRQALDRHIALTRQETGCLVFEVSADACEPNRFNVYEEFCDRQAFTDHQQRVQNSVWGAITARVSRHYSIEEVN